MEKLKKNERKQSFTARIRTSANCLMLPANWKEFGNSRSLIEKIKEVNCDKDISSVIEKIRIDNEEQKASTNVQDVDSLMKGSNFKKNFKKQKFADRRVMLPANWKKFDNVALMENIRKVNIDKDISSMIKKIRNNKVEQKLSTNDRRVMLPANWKELESSGGDLCAKIQEVNSGKEMSVIVAKLRSKLITEKMAKKMKVKMFNSKSSSKFTELFARLESKKGGNFKKTSKADGIQLPAEWKNLGLSDILAEKLKAQNPDMDIPSELLNNLTRGKLGNSGVERKKSSSSVKLPVNWMKSSGSWTEILEGLDLEAEAKSKILENRMKSAYENEKRDKHCRPLKEKRIKKSLRRPERTSSGIKLPHNWKKLTDKDLAETIRKEGLGSEDKQRLIANFERSQASQRHGGSNKLREKHSKKKPKNSSSKPSGSCRSRIHQKKITHNIHKNVRREKKVVKKYSPTFSTILVITEEEKAKLLKPYELGWRRECRVGLTGARLTPEGNFIDEKIRIDIYYWPPSPFSQLEELPAHCKNKELRSFGARRIKNVEEMKEYLAEQSKKRPSKLGLKNFSFKKKILNLGKFESKFFSDEAKMNLEKRRQAKAAEVNEASCHLETFVGNQTDSFGVISDLDDEDNLSAPHGENAEVLQPLSSQGVGETTNHHVDEHPEQDLQEKENVDPIKNDKRKKGQSKMKENMRKLNIRTSKFSQNVGLKQDRPVGKALKLFCSTYSLEMSSLQFWCGKTKLCGDEKVEELEEMIIRVTEGSECYQGDEENDFEMRITCS